MPNTKDKLVLRCHESKEKIVRISAVANKKVLLELYHCFFKATTLTFQSYAVIPTALDGVIEMDDSHRRCASLIDDIDLLVDEESGHGVGNARLVLSAKRVDGPKSYKFNTKKAQLLREMREAFIEPVSKSIRMSQLLTFCHQNGLELVTHHSTINVRACVLIRTPAFDIIVEGAIAG